MTLPAGTRLGPYGIVAHIGSGGMGQVYRAHDPRIGRDVAIKVLPAALAADPERLRRFEQETRATGLLNHPNILTIYDAGTLDSGAPFIVTELLDGRTLRDELGRGALPTRTALDYAIQIARGLAAAHAKGIVHRDLKPENLFVTADRRVKILDFGIAKLAAPDDSVGETRAAPTATGAGFVVGTVEYMSPEQARGEQVDRRSDLFTFGVILHEMLAGERPFSGRTPADVISAVLRDLPTPLPDVVARSAPSLEHVIGRCLEKEPARRVQSADELVVRLETLATGAGGHSVREAEAQPMRGARRSAVIAAAVAIVGVIGALLWLTQRREAPQIQRSSVAARVTPFLGSDATEGHPAWSPTGNLIAYVSDAAGNDDIWISDPSGTNPINLTADFDGTDSMPAWSPDGQRVAFYSDRGGGGIFTMNALGGDVRKVTSFKPGVLYTFSLAWSRDGSLVYTNFDGQGIKQVYRAAVSDASVSCMTCALSLREGARSGELSPSGELLVYKTSEIGPRGTVLILHVASGRMTRVVDQADMPRWAADGARIVFISGRDGTPDLWQIDIDPVSGAPAGEPERLTSGLLVSAFAMSPDGRQILAVTQKSHASLWTFPATADRISDLSEGERWTTGQFLDTRARWLPDAAGVVFQSNRRGSLDIWTLASPMAAVMRLTTGAGTEHRPRVSPHGQWIAFDVIDSSGEYTHVMRRDGTGIRIPDDGWRQRFSMTCCADWSPDGTRFAMHVDGSAMAIVRVDPATGAALETTMFDLPGAADEYHRWSPDGRLIAYEAVTEGSWDLWVVKSDGSEPRRLTTLPGNERSAAWHPSGSWVYFADDARAIWRIGVDESGGATGAPERWLQLTGGLEVAGDGMDFTRAGDRVLVSVRERASDIWLVELVPGSR